MTKESSGMTEEVPAMSGKYGNGDKKKAVISELFH